MGSLQHLPGEGPIILHRKLGLHERYSVTRYNIGAPPILAYGARLTSRSSDTAQVVHAHIARRVEVALKSLPLLSCFVEGAKTRQPRFASRGEIAIEDVLLPLRKERVDAAVATSSSRPTLERLIEEAVDQPVQGLLDLTSAPLWRVQVIEEGPEIFVLLTVGHVICDGRGAGNLLELLFEGLDTTSGSHDSAATASSAIDRLTVPPSSDRLLIPSLRYALGVAFQELVVPRLPSELGSWFQASPAWPAANAAGRTEGKLLIPPLKASKRVKLLSFPHGTIAALKAIGRTNSVMTVHPILSTVCAVATYAMAMTNKVSNIDDGYSSSVRISSETAINIRGLMKDTREHTECTGNFAAALHWEAEVAPNDNFWDMARSYAARVASDSDRQKARYAVGVLSYLPDPASHAPPSEKIPTAWESWLHDKAMSDRPHSASFVLSNLGKISIPVRAGVQEVAWNARAQPTAGLMEVDVSGLELQGGQQGDEATAPACDLSMCIGWSHGVLSEDDSREYLFFDTMRRCIDLLAAMGAASRQQLTVGDLLASLDVGAGIL